MAQSSLIGLAQAAKSWGMIVAGFSKGARNGSWLGLQINLAKQFILKKCPKSVLPSLLDAQTDARHLRDNQAIHVKE
jgi:hypothetical protein